MINLEFDWDDGNTKHVIDDYPQRGNTKEEVESIFYDPDNMGAFDRQDTNTGELRYWILGIGLQGIVKYVVFVNRNGKIRPITCYTAKRNQRTKYHEHVSAKRGKDGAGDQELVIPERG